MGDAARERMERRKAKILAAGEDRLKKITQSYSAPAQDMPATPPLAASSSVEGTPTPPKAAPVMPTVAAAAAAPASPAPAPSSCDFPAAPRTTRVDPAKAAELEQRERDMYEQILGLARGGGTAGVPPVLDPAALSSAGKLSSLPKPDGLTGAAGPSEEDEQPSLPKRSRVPILDRVLLLGRMALAMGFAWVCLYYGFVVEKGGVDESIAAEEEDEGYLLPAVRLFTSKPLHTSMPVEFLGISLPAWMFFVLVELFLQSFRFLTRKRTPLFGEDSMLLEVANSLGLPSVVKTITEFATSVQDIYLIFTSLVSDVQVFVFAMGLFVLVSRLFVVAVDDGDGASLPPIGLSDEL
ncbi:hypothetical protein DFJ73DRAFT_827134 [Zopfochytrium polystomum]|nr:hypothetical protein DFJ73DRAFT_827134 [Zopfochytrium polystomum]